MKVRVKSVSAVSAEVVGNDPALRPDSQQTAAVCYLSTEPSIGVMFRFDVAPSRRREMAQQEGIETVLPLKSSGRLRLVRPVDHHSIVGTSRPEVVPPLGRSVVDAGSGIHEKFLVSGRHDDGQGIGVSVPASGETKSTEVKQHVVVRIVPAGSAGEVSRIRKKTIHASRGL